jgi:hypothetical protein
MGAPQQRKTDVIVLIASSMSDKYSTVLVNDQLDALFPNVFISCLYMFRAQVFIIRRAKLY